MQQNPSETCPVQCGSMQEALYGALSFNASDHLPPSSHNFLRLETSTATRILPQVLPHRVEANRFPATAEWRLFPDLPRGKLAETSVAQIHAQPHISQSARRNLHLTSSCGGWMHQEAWCRCGALAAPQSVSRHKVSLRFR
jgi:hypothetical protein